jgi:hypothetical protein
VQFSGEEVSGKIRHYKENLYYFQGKTLENRKKMNFTEIL